MKRKGMNPENLQDSSRPLPRRNLVTLYKYMYMKNVLSVAAMAVVLGFASASMAQGFNGPAQTGGFQGPGLSSTTVAEALKMGDDTAVVLEGKIEKSLGKEQYMFSDATGSVTIEIDNDDWRGVTVTPNDTVIIRGEVEKDFFKTEIDVDAIELKK